MVRLSTDERTAISDLLSCIAEAMSRLDDIDPRYANKTKLQKLLHVAIDEFDLPITYSWYLAGAIVPADGVSPSGLESAFDSLPKPETPSAPDPSEESVDHAESTSIPPSDVSISEDTAADLDDIV